MSDLIKIREVTVGMVEFTLVPETEDIPVRGNALASGDPRVDQEAENEILAALAQGNCWAWCGVRVTAHWHGFEGDAYLGCCSYRDKADFLENSGYYADLQKQALADLNTKILQMFVDLKPLLEIRRAEDFPS